MTGVEAEWDPDNGKCKLYTKYGKEIAGDDIGAFFSFDTAEGEQIEVELGVSFVSIENARLNLNKEQEGKNFEQVHAEARERWNDDLSRILVEGGTQEQKTVFYTAMYHLLIHPNVLQDVNGEYPAMESDKILTTQGNRYTVFSLWDTYRNVHQLLTLVYPERQIEMVTYDASICIVNTDGAQVGIVWPGDADYGGRSQYSRYSGYLDEGIAGF